MKRTESIHRSVYGTSRWPRQLGKNARFARKLIFRNAPEIILGYAQKRKPGVRRKSGDKEGKIDVK